MKNVACLFCYLTAATSLCVAGQRFEDTATRVSPPHTFFDARIVESLDLVPSETRWTSVLTFGPYTWHRGRGPYNSKPRYTAVEWETDPRWSFGAATFANSFSQECLFAYVGRRYKFGRGENGFFLKISGGIMQGYTGEWKNAVPLNWHGFNPAIIPSVGYRYKNVSIQLIVFGVAYGAMPMTSYYSR